MNITIKDFIPINKWVEENKLEKDRKKWKDGTSESIVDLSTNRRYWNEPKAVVGTKCFLLTLGTPIVHAIASLVNIAFRIVKLVTLYHFWKHRCNEGSYNFKARLKDAAKDLLRIAMQPIALIGLELSALYGMLRPYDGRKLYASIERAQYGSFILAPCFQPDPKKHLLGGDPKEKGAF